jgi:NAD-dependent DNA ligase
MPSDKLTRILSAKSPFTVAKIAAMSEADGWNWVYANAKPRKEKLTQVCFTGFSAAEKVELSAWATAARLEVVTSVTKSLAFLCAGANAGPAKLEKAREQGVHVLTRAQLIHLLETGEVPGA